MRVFETQTVSLENVYCLIYVYSTLEYCIQSNTVISMQYTVYSQIALSQMYCIQITVKLHTTLYVKLDAPYM